MTAEQIHLYAVARCVVPIGTGLSTIREPIIGPRNNALYTLVLWNGNERRWLAIASSDLRRLDDERLRYLIASSIGVNGRASLHPPA